MEITKNMKICLVFFTGLLCSATINLPIKAQSTHQNKCSEYQKVLGKLRDVETRLAIEHARFTDENPLIKALQKEHERLLKLLQGKTSYYSTNQCMMPNSSISQPVMGLW
jgi:hypothetical protein